MTMTSKDRAALRGEAHHLMAAVHVGHQGLTETVIATVDDALRTRELVKIQLAKTTDETPRAAANRLAEATRAEVVQVIGRTCTLYRWNPDLKRKDGVPPWRN
ncbi:MAG: ribosome assembly RNA-binding protein YhbY [Gemmatimonadaceae bacterium]|nr:ribosome assembly RNA-binding protein YhbY [Gemmatimonadaceae bacterium]